MKLRASLPGSVIGVPDALCLLTVHAHPDDESSKGAGTVARYHAEGVRTVLVCCTGGEEGEVLNPALDTPEVHARLPDLRREELAEATEIIGYDEVVMLGLPRLGHGRRRRPTPTRPASPRPRWTRRWSAWWPWSAPSRPQVMVIYGDEQSGYPHPDHLRVHEVGLAAFRAAGDPDRFPEAGPAWQPAKLYYTEFSVARFREIHEKFEELGLESPFDEEWRKRWEDDPRPPGHHLDRHRRLRRRPQRRPAGPRHPGRPHVAVLVRAAPRGHAVHPSLRRLPAGPGGRAPTAAGGARATPSRAVPRRSRVEADLFAAAAPGANRCSGTGPSR